MNGLRKTGDFIFGMIPELLLFGLETIEAHEVFSQKTLSYWSHDHLDFMRTSYKAQFSRSYQTTQETKPQNQNVNRFRCWHVSAKAPLSLKTWRKEERV